MKNLYDIDELKGVNIIHAITNMLFQLYLDDNEITRLTEITLDRIYAEIDSVGIKFTEKGDIILC